MAKGGIKLESLAVVLSMTLKTNTGVTQGDVLAFDTDGLAPITAASVGPFFVALDTVAAPGAGLQATARVLKSGVTTVSTTAAAVSAGKYVVAGGAGVVKQKTDGHTHTENTAATYTQNATTASTTPQSEQIVGIALTSIGAAGGEIDILLFP